ncbi:oxygenase MpaB family protein [Hyalangium rubrum]|uniref:Oxygenase MpaB family protein n=1 Tax=Hyalangium rubrum TaxID=3103134 RepID=A0ABU5HF42_9BACT|nr:oxygenase MpaB family protein [Hyalangium sp. s54d21]MDY7231772.1 oxygenase MpaB family protein [Hyalangium sp. s54d21]
MMKERAWTDDFLNTMREQCDPLADETVRNLFQQGKVPATNALMKQLVVNEQVSLEMLAPPLRDYFEQTGQLPSWAEPRLILQGEELFGRHGPSIVTALFCASLPSCYAASKLVQVLHLTARLESNPYRRIVETMQMIIDVMAPGGLAQGGRGLRSAQKVRLMHAAVRHLILQRGTWNSEWGQPINQEDMAFTLLTFSTIVLRSLDRMGCVLTDAERRAYYHAWRVVGHVMGIDARLMPETPEEGARFEQVLQRRLFGATPEGQMMTRALLQLMEHITPGNLFDGLPATLMRHLMGKDTAEMLAVPASDWTSLLMGPLQALGWVSHEMVDLHGPGAAKLAGMFGRRLVEGLFWVNRGPERVPFRLPTTLRDSWDVRGWERA